IRLAGLDVANADLLRSTPLDEGLGGELGPVVDAHPGRPAVEADEVVEDADDPRARNRGADLDGEALPVALVDHVEGSKPAAVVEGVDHEIERPGLIQARRRDQRLTDSRRNPALRAAR